MCFSIKLGIHIINSGRMDPIDIGGQRSKVYATMGIIDKCRVRGVATPYVPDHAYMSVCVHVLVTLLPCEPLET